MDFLKALLGAIFGGKSLIDSSKTKTINISGHVEHLHIGDEHPGIGNGLDSILDTTALKEVKDFKTLCAVPACSTK